jgi:hypothetical protein
MKQLIVTLIVLLSFLTNANAQNAVAVSTPFQGVLLSTKQAGRVKQQLIDGDLCDELNLSNVITIDMLKSKQDLTEKQNKILLDQTSALENQLQNDSQFNTIKFIGMFILGVAVTVGASKLAK